MSSSSSSSSTWPRRRSRMAHLTLASTTSRRTVVFAFGTKPSQSRYSSKAVPTGEIEAISSVLVDHDSVGVVPFRCLVPQKPFRRANLGVVGSRRRRRRLGLPRLRKGLVVESSENIFHSHSAGRPFKIFLSPPPFDGEWGRILNKLKLLNYKLPC